MKKQQPLRPGDRRIPQVSASDAQPYAAACGVGPRSVWAGTARAVGERRGAPMLRR